METNVISTEYSTVQRMITDQPKMILTSSDRTYIANRRMPRTGSIIGYDISKAWYSFILNNI